MLSFADIEQLREMMLREGMLPPETAGFEWRLVPLSVRTAHVPVYAGPVLVRPDGSELERTPVMREPVTLNNRLEFPPGKGPPYIRRVHIGVGVRSRTILYSVE